ncbi:hypothetical protein PZH42_31505, partial [Bacteroides cellulosilyticus]
LSANFTYSIGNDVYNANKIEYTSSYQYYYRNMLDIMGEEVEERHVPERDVAHGHVVVTGVFGFDALESLYPHPFFGVQDVAAEQDAGIFLSLTAI